MILSNKTNNADDNYLQICKHVNDDFRVVMHGFNEWQSSYAGVITESYGAVLQNLSKTVYQMLDYKVQHFYSHIRLTHTPKDAVPGVVNMYRFNMEVIATAISSLSRRFNAGLKTENDIDAFNTDLKLIVDKVDYHLDGEEADLHPLYDSDFHNNHEQWRSIDHKATDDTIKTGLYLYGFVMVAAFSMLALLPTQTVILPFLGLVAIANGGLLLGAMCVFLSLVLAADK